MKRVNLIQRSNVLKSSRSFHSSLRRRFNQSRVSSFHTSSSLLRWDPHAHKQYQQEKGKLHKNDESSGYQEDEEDNVKSGPVQRHSSLTIWFTTLAQMLVIASGAYLVYYFRNRLIVEEEERVVNDKKNEFLNPGIDQELFFTVDELDIASEFKHEAWYDTIWRYIRISVRILHLSILFTPALVTYWIQAYLFPSYYEWWCILVVKTLELAGPCFIKLGQWAATRPDLFTETFCEYLSSLHAQAPYHRFRHTKWMIENAFGKSIQELFDEFHERPIASGAIAQIHKAKLKGSDRYCAVKVRHPRVEQLTLRDLSIIHLVSRFFEQFETFAWLNLHENVLSFSKNMKAQSNLNIEAQSLLRFAKNFRFIPSIHFPTPILHSNDVLIETFEEGLPITQYMDTKYPKELRSKLAVMGTSMYLKMMLVDNMIHADLHPGNLKVRIKDNEPVLVVLDAGLTTSLSPTDRTNFIDLFSAILSGDSEHAAALMIERGKGGALIMKDPVKTANFKREMADLIKYVMDRSLSELEVGVILQRALQLGRKYQVLLESNFTTLVIGTVVIEGLGRQLNPEFNFIQAARPYLQGESQVRSAYVMRNLKRYNAGKRLD